MVSRSIIFIISFSLLACCKKSDPTGTTITKPLGSTTPEVKVPVKSDNDIFVEKLMAAKKVEESLPLCKPSMGSATLGNWSSGHKLFALWAVENSTNLSWNDFNVATNETTIGLIRKNPEKESGKKICVTGKIVQINETKANLSQGLFITGDRVIYSFAGIKSSGDLTEDSVSKFCGYVTGTYDYSNSVGGVGHAISIVGMWSVPDNLKLSFCPDVLGRFFCWHVPCY